MDFFRYSTQPRTAAPDNPEAFEKGFREGKDTTDRLGETLFDAVNRR